MAEENDLADPDNQFGGGDSRTQRITEMVDAFLLERASNPNASAQELLENNSHLMPELGQMLSRVMRIDAARMDAATAKAAELATCETTDFDGRVASAVGLNVRCPHCFHQIVLGNDDQLVKIRCAGCGNSFGLVDNDGDDSAALRVIGNFECVERLGAGSFGTVWKARDTELDRFVAIKVPRKGKLEPREMEQFVREARVTAQLNHGGIVRVYEVGRDDDSVYIVSDWVDGEPLTKRLESGSLDHREAAELITRIADALDHAHAVGVVHRDLKPANIMMDKAGSPFVTDFGLAKRHAGDVTITADGHILGTPAYMSPEQASGRPDQTDRRADVYSLGVIMFELLTGERPFRGDISRLIQKVIKSDPPRPRDLRRSVPRDLETICLKCLEKDPDRRYQTAGALRDDLQRWLDDEPILARPIGRFEKLRRWCRKNPAITAVVATAILTLVLTTEAGISVAKTRSAGLKVAIEELNAYARRDSAELQELRALVREASYGVASEDFDPHKSSKLDRLVEKLYDDNDRATQSGLHPFATWFILDQHGTMLAVTPERHRVDGRDFHKRDYFAGAMKLKDHEVYTSAPFRSENDGLVKFSLAAPLSIANERYVLAASVATDSTRAIQREERLMRVMFRWTAVALTPSVALVTWLVSHGALAFFRRASEPQGEASQ
ncbi:MAG: protein kinase [Planctomycetales bacterium]|nr:protein kinase [Planctomycetales bacterium]